MKTLVKFSREYQPWLCAATRDVRPSLTGIAIDPDGWMVAADGYQLCAVPCTIEGVLEHVSLVQATFVKNVTKWWPKNLGEPEFEVDEEQHTATFNLQSKITVPLIQQSFPQWRTMVPKHIVPLGDHLFADPSRIQSACRAIGIDRCHIWAGGERRGSPLVLPGHAGAIAVVMPMEGSTGEMDLRHSLNKIHGEPTGRRVFFAA